MTVIEIKNNNIKFVLNLLVNEGNKRYQLLIREYKAPHMYGNIKNGEKTATWF
jgi:hypothetical protein